MDGIDPALLTLWPLALRLIVQERASRFHIGHCPCVSTLCLPDVTAHAHMTNLPDLPPMYLHAASDQILEVEMAQEQGYNGCTIDVTVIIYSFPLVCGL